MNNLGNDDLKIICGGASVSGNFLNYLSKLINTVFDIGRSIGSAINYSKNKRTC